MHTIDGDTRLKKRPRKTRGKGLRATTGCLTCRKRHKKCDEHRPVCGPCSISARHCVFPQAVASESPRSTVADDSRAGATESLPNETSFSSQPESTENQASATSDNVPLDRRQSRPTNDVRCSVDGEAADGNRSRPALHDGYGGPILSPGSTASDAWSAYFASTRWLDLLANDAAQADNNFPLVISPVPRDRRRRWSAAEEPSVHVSPALLNGQAQLPDDLDPEFERTTWQPAADVVLSAYEAGLFRHFADRCASWLDVFDQYRLFSTYAIRLAMRNLGLMKAILAMASKHRFSGSRTESTAPTAVSSSAAGAEAVVRTPRDGSDQHEDGEWIRYYYETLQYVREALQYPSYSHSEELLATALVISAYEMLDEADGSGNWQRHLKGIFWIQRSQDVDGGCGGLRQPVWWAWLRQDVWAAFRESRTCLTFWVPRQSFQELDQDQLVDRSIYLLAQAVNCRANVLAATSTSAGASPAAAKAANLLNLENQRQRLLSTMEEWKACLGDEYRVLPTPGSVAGEAFTSLWIHPPRFGAALQAYNFAQILLTLHGVEAEPLGFKGYLKMQRTLADAVDTICGIAMGLTEEGCQILSAQCLYGAGLCVTGRQRRDKIISLMEDCERRGPLGANGYVERRPASAMGDG